MPLRRLTYSIVRAAVAHACVSCAWLAHCLNKRPARFPPGQSASGVSSSTRSDCVAEQLTPCRPPRHLATPAGSAAAGLASGEAWQLQRLCRRRPAGQRAPGAVALRPSTASRCTASTATPAGRAELVCCLLLVAVRSKSRTVLPPGPASTCGERNPRNRLRRSERPAGTAAARRSLPSWIWLTLFRWRRVQAVPRQQWRHRDSRQGQRQWACPDRQDRQHDRPLRHQGVARLSWAARQWPQQQRGGGKAVGSALALLRPLNLCCTRTASHTGDCGVW